MLKSLRSLLEFRIQSTDGYLGRVRDFHFDADTGRLKYAVSSLGCHYPWHSVLIPIEELGPPDGAACTIPVNKSCAELRSYPAVSADPPVFYQIQEHARNFYTWAAQWTPLSGQPEPEPVFCPIPGSTRQSLKHLLGYEIWTTDGKAGVLSDLFADPETMNIRAIATDAGQDKRILVLVDFIRSISCDRRSIYLEIDRAGLVGAPEFDPLRFDDLTVEERLQAHYIRTLQHV